MGNYFNQSLKWAFLAVSIGLCPLPAYSDYIHPENVVVKTKVYEPKVTDFRRGTYKYGVSWQGIPVASCAVEIRDDFQNGQPFVRVDTKTITAKVIRLFYKLKHESFSIFHPLTIQPKFFLTHQVENSREKTRTIDFHEDGTVTAKYYKGGVAEKEMSFKTTNKVLDPISAAFLAKSVDIGPNKKASFDVFNGKHRYLISFEVVGREVLKINGNRYDTYKIRPTVKKLTDTKGEDRLNYAYLWVSADDRREILQLESDIWLGSVKARFEEFSPELPTLGPVQAAALHTKETNQIVPEL